MIPMKLTLGRLDAVTWPSGLPWPLHLPNKIWSLLCLFPCYTLLQHLSQYSATIWHVSTASQTHGKNDILFQSWEIFFVKGQRVYSLHTLGQMVSVATTQLCLCHRKAATDMQENEQWTTTYRNRQWARFGLQVVGCQRLPYSPNS